MSEKLILFGTGGIAEVVHFYLKNDSPYKVVGFTVDKAFIKDRELLGLPIAPFKEVEKIFPPEEHKMFIAVGYTNVNKIRAEKYYQAKEKGFQLISYISPDAICHSEEIGDNCFIFENNVIQPFVKIGNDVIIWSGNHIGHHSVIGDHCFIASHVVISGNVKIEPYCFLGVNSTIRNGITIARESVIGAGALILNNTVEKGVYVGNQAELSKVRSDKLKNL